MTRAPGATRRSSRGGRSGFAVATVLSIMTLLAAGAQAQPDGDPTTDPTTIDLGPMADALTRIEPLSTRLDGLHFDAAFLSTATAASALSRDDARGVFNWVRENIAFEPYAGRVRGARGTLFTRAGNSIDTSLLVASMLGELGVSWRLVYMGLSDDQVDALLSTAVPRAVLEGAEEVPGFDPTQATARRRAVLEHWWVQARVDDDWVDIDPVFPGLDYDDEVGSPTERVRAGAEPDSFRHTASIRLRYRQGRRPTETALTYTADIVDLAYRNLVLTFHQTGRARVRPVLSTGQESTEGSILDLEQAEHIWLEFEFGFGESAFRVDRDLRLTPSDDEAWLDPFAGSLQVYSILFLPGWVGPDYHRAVSRSLAHRISNQLGDLSTGLATSENPQGSRGLPEAVREPLSQTLASLAGLIGLSYAAVSDELALGLAPQAGVAAFFLRPRIVVTSAVQRGNDIGFQLDVVDDRVDTVTFAGVPLRLADAFQTLRGRINSELAGRVLRLLTGQDVVAATDLLNEGFRARRDFISVSATSLRILRHLETSSQVRARIEAGATGGGGIVVTPSQGLSLAGRARTAWWQLFSVDGRPSAVLDSGIHGAESGFFTAGLSDPADVEFATLGLNALGLVEMVFAGLVAQLESGYDIRDRACDFVCDLQRVSAVTCDGDSPAHFDACLAGTAATDSDDPLGLGLSCADMAMPYRCGVLLSEAMMDGGLTVQVESGAANFGPFSTPREPMSTAPCSCQ